VTDLATGRNLGELAHGLPGPTTGWEPGTGFQPTGVAITPDGATVVMGVSCGSASFLPLPVLYGERSDRPCDPGEGRGTLEITSAVLAG